MSLKKETTMKCQLNWTQGMKFDAQSEGNEVKMDAKSPIGQSSAMTPKELVAAGLGGCTAMDVVALLKKHKQSFTSFKVDIDIETEKRLSAQVFSKAVLSFILEGDVDPKIYLEAVKLSQTKYCGVSAMLSQSFPIEYKVILNQTEIGEGKAHFE